MKSRSWRSAGVLAAVLALLVACGSSESGGDANSGSAPPSQPAQTETTTEGSPSSQTTAAGDKTQGSSAAPDDTGQVPDGATGVSSIPGCENLVIDTAPGSPSPICDAGAPAAQPLAEKTSLRISYQKSVETNALYSMADAEGEFAAENLDVEAVQLPFTDALPMLTSGELDLACSGPHSSFFNAVNQGFDVKWVLSKYYEPEGPYGGLWAQPGMTVADLKGATIGSALGATTSSMAAVMEILATGGLTLKDVTIKQITTTDMVLALKNGAIDAGIVTTPGWMGLMNDDGTTDYEFLGSVVPKGSSVYGCMAGPNLLVKNRDAGVALMRAIARTQFTYFRPGWKDDTEFVKKMADVIDSKPEAIEKTPEAIFDWLIRTGTTDSLQDAFMQLDVLQSDEPVAESEIVDQSLMYEALGVEVS